MKIIYIIFFLLLLYVYVYFYRWSIELDIYIYDSGIDGPTLLLIAGTHGNEPAGNIVLSSSLFKPKKGKIIVIPSVNKFGLLFGIRYNSFNFLSKKSDINRNYENEGTEEISKEILKYVREIDENSMIIDFHEGWGYYKIDEDSIGSTLTPTTNVSVEYSNFIIENLNKTIVDDDKKFVINKKKDIKNTLRDYCNKNNINYILVETTGQNNKQKMSKRLEQIRIIIDSTIEKMGL